jgi:hypothetical protein
MKRISGFLIAATLVSLALASVVSAQQAGAEGNVIIRQRVMQGPEGGPPPPTPDTNFVFIASESFGGKVVKGAPYSGEAITETIQTLSDGNRIVNRMTSSVYRDSEGRTRREQSLKGLGMFGAGEQPFQTIFINDPVGGVTFTLDTNSKTAHKSVPFTFEFQKKLDKAGAAVSAIEGQRFEFKLEQGTANSQKMTLTVPPGEGVRMPHPDLDQLRAEAGAAGTFVYRTKPDPNANEVKEQLGKQTIEGVEAEGTRTTVTIPAGEIGNERPIEIVSERWYSPELQLVVMTRHSDPRFGETTYKLTNINRSEPAKSLFEVPSDFTIKEGPAIGPKIAPLPRKREKPE